MLTGLHFLTHIGQSWIVARLGRRTVRDQWLVVLGGTVLDLDGVGIVWSEDAYLATHRVLGHGFLCAVAVMAIAMVTADAPWLTAALCGAAFHLHVLLDAVGTGGVPIQYFWPFSRSGLSYAGRWDLSSWPNMVVMAVTFATVLVLVWRRAVARRTE